jgi:hypothetical protein
MSARLNNLVFDDHEILAQAGERSGRRSKFQIAQTALKIGLVGQHGKYRRAARPVAAGQAFHVKILSDKPLGGRSLLDLRYYRWTHRRLTPQRRCPAARPVRRRPPLELRQGYARFGRSHGGPR